MKGNTLFIFLVMAILFFVSCENNIQGKEDVGNSADSADTGNTADTSNTGDTSDTGDTADSGDTADTGDTATPIVVGSFEVAYSGDIVDAGTTGDGGTGDAEFSFNENEMVYTDMNLGGYLHLPAATLSAGKISVRWMEPMKTGVTEYGVFIVGFDKTAPVGEFSFSAHGGYALHAKAELLGGSFSLKCAYAVSNPEKSQMNITSKSDTEVKYTASGELLDPKIIEDDLTIPICE